MVTDLFILKGVPAYIHSDNGPEFVAKVVRDWTAAVGATTAFVEPGSPWENGSYENFNGRPRDAPLNGEIVNSLREAQIVIESPASLQRREASQLSWIPAASTRG